MNKQPSSRLSKAPLVVCREANQVIRKHLLGMPCIELLALFVVLEAERSLSRNFHIWVVLIIDFVVDLCTSRSAGVVIDITSIRDELVS